MVTETMVKRCFPSSLTYRKTRNKELQNDFELNENQAFTEKDGLQSNFHQKKD